MILANFFTEVFGDNKLFLRFELGLTNQNLSRVRLAHSKSEAQRPNWGFCIGPTQRYLLDPAHIPSITYLFPW